MIDENKIEEAKKAYIADKKILGIIAMNDLACGFKEGANWAINEFLKGLWHPISDKPEEHTDIIYIDEDKDFWDINNYDSNNFDDSFGKGWKSACRTQDIYKWAYKDDLLPKKGGKQ